MPHLAQIAAAAPSLLHKRLTEYLQLPTVALLNRCSSTRMPFEWTINPYRGCEFGCHYCYARYTHTFLELNDPEEFSARIFAKQWNPAAFRDDLRRIGPRDRIALGAATDPYQPAERRFGLTRSILEVFAGMKGHSLGITTKSDLILRDLDLLTTIAKSNRLIISITVTTTDAGLARLLEPRAPRPDLRVETIRSLRQAGLATGVLCCPVMPLINDSDAQLNAVAEAASGAGALWLGANVLYLTEAPRAAFFPFLEQHFPHLVAKYKRHFEGKIYLRGAYPKLIKERLRRIRTRHKFPTRDELEPFQAPPAELQFSLPFEPLGNAG